MFFYREIVQQPSYLTTGLVVNLDAAEATSYSGTGNTWYDISGQSNNGSLVNSPAYSSNNSGYLEFNNGTNQYCEVNPGTPFNLYCLDIWIYNNYAIPNDDSPIGGPNTYQTLVEWAQDNQSGGSGINLGGWTGAMTNEAIHLWSANDSATYNRDATAVGWHNLIFNWNGSTYDIWLDGVKTTTYPIVGYGGFATLVQNVTQFRIAGRPTSFFYFSGRVAAFKAYNAALTDQQVVQNFDALKARYGL